MPPLARQLVNALTLGLVLWLNGLAGSGALSGESIGLIANRYSSFFLPANYVFGIWSLIYLALTAFTVFQLLPGERSNPAVTAIGWWWPINGALNIAWIVAFSFSLFGTALLVMVLLLVSLIAITERAGADRGVLRAADRLLVIYPFWLYLAWISVALISNTFQFMTVVEWGGFGIPGEVWSSVMMTVAMALAVAMVVHRGNWVFPLVVAWALWGIAVRFHEVPIMTWTVWIVMPLGFLVSAAILWRDRDLERRSPVFGGA